MEVADYSSEGEKLRIINGVSLFSGVGVHEQYLLTDKCIIIQRERDNIIIDQDEVGDCLYVIIKGNVRISKRNTLKEWVYVNTLGPGDVFGEIAILRSYRRTARVTTQTQCVFLTINAKDFLEIYQYFPPQSRDNIQLIIAKRLVQLSE